MKAAAKEIYQLILLSVIGLLVVTIFVTNGLYSRRVQDLNQQLAAFKGKNGTDVETLQREKESLSKEIGILKNTVDQQNQQIKSLENLKEEIKQTIQENEALQKDNAFVKGQLDGYKMAYERENNQTLVKGTFVQYLGKMRNAVDLGEDNNIYFFQDNDVFTRFKNTIKPGEKVYLLIKSFWGRQQIIGFYRQE